MPTAFLRLPGAVSLAAGAFLAFGRLHAQGPVVGSTPAAFEFLRLDYYNVTYLSERWYPGTYLEENYTQHPYTGGMVSIRTVEKPVSQYARVFWRDPEDSYVSQLVPSLVGNPYGPLYLELDGVGPYFTPLPAPDKVAIELRFSRPVRLRWSTWDPCNPREVLHTLTDGLPWSGDFFINPEAGLLSGIGTQHLTVTGDPAVMSDDINVPGNFWYRQRDEFPCGTFESDGVTCLTLRLESVLQVAGGAGVDIEVSPMELGEYVDTLVSQGLVSERQALTLLRAHRQSAKAFRAFVSVLRRQDCISACQEQGLLGYAP